MRSDDPPHPLHHLLRGRGVGHANPFRCAEGYTWDRGDVILLEQPPGERRSRLRVTRGGSADAYVQVKRPLRLKHVDGRVAKQLERGITPSLELANHRIDCLARLVAPRQRGQRGVLRDRRRI